MSQQERKAAQLKQSAAEFERRAAQAALLRPKPIAVLVKMAMQQMERKA